MARLYLQLLCDGVTPSAATACVRDVLVVLAPEVAHKARLPGKTWISQVRTTNVNTQRQFGTMVQIRLAMLLLAQVQASIGLLLVDAPATLHTDGTTKAQKKLGTAVLSVHKEGAKDMRVAPRGAYPQSSGRADESNDLAIDALHDLDDILQGLREFLDERGMDADGVLTQLAALTWSLHEQVSTGASESSAVDAALAAAEAALDLAPEEEPTLPVVRSAASSVDSQQTDHAAAAQKQARLAAERLAGAKARAADELWEERTAAEQKRAIAVFQRLMMALAVGCQHHKRTNAESAYEKGEQKVRDALHAAARRSAELAIAYLLVSGADVCR